MKFDIYIKNIQSIQLIVKFSKYVDTKYVNFFSGSCNY